MTDMARHNFHMGVRYMSLYWDAAYPEDVIDALQVLGDIFEYSEPDEFVDSSKAILVSKAIDVAYTACSGACNEHGLSLQECIDELDHELNYWK